MLLLPRSICTRHFKLGRLLSQRRCHKQLPEPAGVRAPSPFSELFGGWPVLPEAGAVATQTDASHEEEEKEFEEPGADEHEEGLEAFLGRVDKVGAVVQLFVLKQQ